MIEVTPRALEYFQGLIERQGLNGMGLRIHVLEPDTPRATCDLQFCPEDQAQANDERVSFDAFELYVAPDSIAWLGEAEIDFEDEITGGQLTIKAPNIKGSAPGEDEPLAGRIEWILQSEVNPQLASHGGHVALVTVTEAKEVVLEFGGGCHGCGMADMTLKQGIETTLTRHFPEITGVLDVTDHSSGENPYYAPDS